MYILISTEVLLKCSLVLLICVDLLLEISGCSVSPCSLYVG